MTTAAVPVHDPPRGLFQKDYAGPTLRDNLGLAIPRAADWHAAQRAGE